MVDLSDKKRIAIIGAGTFQVPLIRRAKELGYDTHVFAWEEGAEGKDLADCFYPISIAEKEKILSECIEIDPDGICSVGSDLAVIAVNFVSENLGLPCNRSTDSLAMTNKYEMRKKMQQAGLPTPAFQKIDVLNLKNLEWKQFPAIVKPTDRSGSRAISLVRCREELLAAAATAIEASFSKQAIVEQYLRGQEYSCETISQDSRHHFLAITQKFTSGEPSYIETGHRIPCDLSQEIKNEVKKVVFSALDALGFRNSAGHTEIRVDEEGNISIIEIGARMGGDCIGSHLVPLATGYDFLRMVIDVACGNSLDFTLLPHYNSAEIEFLITPEDVRRFEALNSCGKLDLKEVSKIDLTHIGNATDSSTRGGYYIFIPRENQ